MNTIRNLIDAAKVIQPHLAKFAEEGLVHPRTTKHRGAAWPLVLSGARVWMSKHSSLHAVVWTPRAESMGPAERQNAVWRHMESLPRSVAQDVGQISVLTPEEYEELHFFTRPPFCDPELA